MSTKLRLVFAGTPDFAVPCLHACHQENVEIVAVYTQPDRPTGRGQRLAFSPLKQAALTAGIALEQPNTLRDAAAQARLTAYAPDLLVVVAYGLILPSRVLKIPRHGCWNVHASLLPRWRGAAPIQRTILAGDSETGICLMQMERGLDTGPVLARCRTPILATDTGGQLHDRLATLGANLLAENLTRLVQGEKLTAEPQAQEGVTYAHKLEKTEAPMDWTQPAAVLERKVRAFNPWPIAEAEIGGERLRIWAAQTQSHNVAEPGTLIAATRAGLDIATNDGVLRITELQRAGGRRMPVADYLSARPELRKATAS